MFHDGDQFIKPLNVGGTLPISQEKLEKIPVRDCKVAMRTAMELLCRLEHWRTRDRTAVYWSKSVPFFSSPTRAEDEASSLPCFSEVTWLEWFESCWAILMQENDDRPELNIDLRTLGMYRQGHTELTSLQSASRRPRSPESNIRDGIKSRLKDAIKRLSRTSY